MITKDMITAGYKAGIVKIVDSPNDDGAVCQIGANWFYFGGQTAEEHSAEEYKRFVPEKDIVNEIFNALDDFRDSGAEFDDEYLYYEMFLNENGIGSVPSGTKPSKKSKINKHKIAISMEDDEIERTSTTLIITTKDSLAKVSDKLNIAFEKFDRAEGVAADFREDGWGIDSFVSYLKHRYRKSWTIEEDIPDETFEFVGM